MSSPSGSPGWKWTERDEYRADAESLGGGDASWVDMVKTAIEDNVLLDPIDGSRPLLPEDHPGHDPAIRYVTIEEAPGLGDIPELTVVFKIEDPPYNPLDEREVTGLSLQKTYDEW
jgi:hypothetical protein